MIIKKRVESNNGKMIKNIEIFQEDEKIGKKAKIHEEVNSSVITTTNGNDFDADELSQNRMVRAIIVMQNKSIDTINWKLYDNTIKEISLDEMIEALQLAGENQSQLWFQ